KPLQELNLIDAFLFAVSTEKIQDAEFIAKLIIERATNEKVDQITVVLEKELTGSTSATTVSIWILPYDPFGKNRMIYTVKNVVEEFPELLYNDGVKRLFLYVGGELGGTEKLKDLLHYFSSSQKGNVTDAELEHLHSIVEKAKYNQKVGKRYMTLQDMIDYEKKESYEDGKAEGREEGILVLISTLKELNVPNDEILKQLMQKISLTMEEAKAYLDAN
ncbi:MAG: hypothetical protein IKJ15_01585, partial [Lachnospiraceae bacterium]|nr:hypothetical protein [Lachnospiraceae bacterium]